MTELTEFRQAKDEFFKTDEQSPLEADQKKNFKCLNYFPENPDLIFEVKLEKFAEIEEIAIGTSSGDTQIYNRYGRLQFVVNSQKVALTIYESETGFYLPFVDKLAGKETYPAGRYLEPEQLDGNRFLIDFNYAYNPYCAYNENWSCPLTPNENRLPVEIRAGEKLFKEHNHTEG